MLDASVALAWCFPDEASPRADRIWAALAGRQVWVPAVWALEVANGMLAGERSRRIRAEDRDRFLDLLAQFTVRVDAAPLTSLVAQVLPLARELNLSAYDAAYLELALRLAGDLATLDQQLGNAGRRAGVTLVA